MDEVPGIRNKCLCRIVAVCATVCACCADGIAHSYTVQPSREGSKDRRVDAALEEHTSLAGIIKESLCTRAQLGAVAYIPLPMLSQPCVVLTIQHVSVLLANAGQEGRAVSAAIVELSKLRDDAHLPQRGLLLQEVVAELVKLLVLEVVDAHQALKHCTGNMPEAQGDAMGWGYCRALDPCLGGMLCLAVI